MIHLFTSFVVTEGCEESVINFYTQQLIPQWVKVHKQFFKSINVVTNIPHRFSKTVPTISLTLQEAFCGYDFSKLNITGSQVGAWKFFVNTLPEDDIAIYLDPDAFMVNDRLYKIANSIKSHALTRIITSVNVCDAGVAILRNNDTTRIMLNNMQHILSNIEIVNHVEVYYNKTYRGIKEMFIPWLKHSLLLRGDICGVNQIPDTIHDCVDISIYNFTLTNDQHKMIDLFVSKKDVRTNYLP